MELCEGGITISGARVPLDGLGSVDKLLARLDSDGLHGGIVAVPPPLFRAELPERDRASYVRAINDSLLEKIEKSRSRLRPLAYLPTERPELAARLADELDARWAGVIIGTGTTVHGYADPHFNDLWAVLSHRELPVLLHPSEAQDPRLRPFYLTNLLGNPFETTLAAAQLVFGDVPGRYPSLKFILSHGGGAVCALAGRWQRGYDVQRPGVGRPSMSPIEAVRTFYVDSVVYQAAQLDAIVSLLGIGRLLLGSDWPFPMGAPAADYDIGHLDERLLQTIRSENPERVFGARLQPGADCDPTAS
jgi:aminocarboxymuconate-semialdehyde decarboxylase